MSRKIYDETVKRPSIRPKLNKAQKEFLSDFATKNQETFERIMSELEEYAPTKWIEAYMKINSMVLPKESNLNVNIGLNKDFQELVSLGRTSTKQIADGSEVVERYEAVNITPGFRKGEPRGKIFKEEHIDDVEVIDGDVYSTDSGKGEE